MIIARAMCAEFHGEDAMCNGDVFHLVSTVENENALLVFALELVFKSHCKALDCCRIDRRANKGHIGFLQVDARDDLDMLLFHQAQQLFHESDDMTLGVVSSFTKRPPQVRAFHLNFEPVVPVCQAIAVCGGRNAF